MPSLKGSKTEQNLKDAFAGESQANRRYLYFAQKADVEGYNDVAAVFRSTAEGETGHAHGHLEFLEEVGDPATGKPIGSTSNNLAAAIAGETHEYTDMYPGMAKPPVTKALPKSPIGSRPWPRRNDPTPIASRRRWINSKLDVFPERAGRIRPFLILIKRCSRLFPVVPASLSLKVSTALCALLLRS